MEMDPQVLAALIGGGFNFAGGLLGGMGQGRLAEMQQQLGGMGLQQQREGMGLQATQMDPLAQQKSRQQQALLAAILPQMRNAGSSAPGGIPQGQRSGGIMDLIPQGGFDQQTQGFFSPQSRANAEGGFYSAAAPFMAPPDLSQLGYGQAGVGPTGQAQGARNDFLHSPEHQAMLKALGQDDPSTSGGKPWWKRALGIAGGVFGAPFTGGLSLPAGLGYGLSG